MALFIDGGSQLDAAGYSLLEALVTKSHTLDDKMARKRLAPLSRVVVIIATRPPPLGSEAALRLSALMRSVDSHIVLQVNC